MVPTSGWWWRQRPNGVSLDVQDSGAGMAQADRQRLGERFFRVLGQNQAGSGLGWSIVRRIAQVTGATVVVQQSKASGRFAGDRGVAASCENRLMPYKKFLIPLASLAFAAVAYRSYGWPGVALVAGGLVMWMLLHFTRMLQVLQRAAHRPVGFVDSAVMLNAKLQQGIAAAACGGPDPRPRHPGISPRHAARALSVDGRFAIHGSVRFSGRQTAALGADPPAARCRPAQRRWPRKISGFANPCSPPTKGHHP